MPGQQSFAAQVSDWVRQTEQRMTAVFRESADQVVSAMQTVAVEGGNMPVDTGFLRASIQASKDEPVPINPDAYPVRGHTYTYDAGPIFLVIHGTELGETIYVTYTAAYAAAQEYGSKGREGRQFVALAAQRWPMIVNAVCGELQSSVDGSTPGT